MTTIKKLYLIILLSVLASYLVSIPFVIIANLYFSTAVIVFIMILRELIILMLIYLFIRKEYILKIEIKKSGKKIIAYTIISILLWSILCYFQVPQDISDSIYSLSYIRDMPLCSMILEQFLYGFCGTNVFILLFGFGFGTKSNKKDAAS